MRRVSMSYKRGVQNAMIFNPANRRLRGSEIARFQRAVTYIKKANALCLSKCRIIKNPLPAAILLPAAPYFYQRYRCAEAQMNASIRTPERKIIIDRLRSLLNPVVW